MQLLTLHPANPIGCLYKDLESAYSSNALDSRCPLFLAAAANLAGSFVLFLFGGIVNDEKRKFLNKKD